MSGRPTNRTGRPTASPIASAANTGASAKLRALTTISAPPRRGRCSVPPTATSHRSRLAAKARATACESQPQSSTSPPDQSRSVRAVPAAVAPAARAGTVTTPAIVLIGLAITPPAAGPACG